MAKKDYYTEYDKISNDLFNERKEEYMQYVDKARDWKTAHQKFVDTVTIPMINQYNIELRNFGMVDINFFNDLEEVYKLDKTKDRPQIFNDMVQKIEQSKRNESVLHLSRMNFQAKWVSFWLDQYKQRDRIHEYAPNEEIYNEEFQSPVSWKADNETEFVQLIYALYEAGYIEHEEKGMTKLIEDFAYLLNFPLGKNWQVNHSTSIHKRNSDYAPQIFDKLNKAYEDFRIKKINKKKNN
jgi:hypothetical protein